MSRTPQEQAEIEAIAKAVGFAISDWGNVEGTLSSIFAASIRAPVFSVAHDAFYSIQSFQAKVKAIDKAYRRQFADQPNLIEKWSTLKKLVMNANNRRNELAHGSVVVIHTSPIRTVGWIPFYTQALLADSLTMSNCEIRLRDQNKPLRYSSSQVQAIQSQFAEANRSAEVLFQEIASYLHDTGKQWNHERI